MQVVYHYKAGIIPFICQLRFLYVLASSYVKLHEAHFSVNHEKSTSTTAIYNIINLLNIQKYSHIYYFLYKNKLCMGFD